MIDTGHRLVRAAAVTLVIAVLASCARQEISLDGPSYGSVGDLAAASEVVVIGRFCGSPARVTEADLGATFEYKNERGLDLDLWDFTVTEVLEGEVDNTIRVTQIVLPGVDSVDRADHERSDSSESAFYTAESGNRAVLFLRAYPDSSAYAVLGLGLGSIEVGPDGALATPVGAPESLAAEVARLGSVAELAELVRSAGG